MFVDRANIYVKAGNGGNGCDSFYFKRGMRFKRRNGGDGGRGGDIIIRTDDNVATLLDFRYRQHYKAGAGKHGSSNFKKGKDALPAVILVPPGTIVREINSGCLIRDLNKSGEQVIVAKGGFGGKGNQSGKPATPGGIGQEYHLSLELKLIADIGLIGYPNAGKSSLLNIISGANSKVGHFPFTTLSPILGVIKSSLPDKRVVVADIPGIIKDAHKGKGLGIEFLKHIERTKVLLFVIDIAGVDGRDPSEDYYSLIEELRSYDAQIIKRPLLIAVNKTDMPQAADNLKNFKQSVKKKIYPISCKEKSGIDVLVSALRKKLETGK